MEIRDKSEIGDFCFYIPKEQRKEFVRPYGILFTSTSELLNYLKSYRMIISVGDYVTLLLQKNGVLPNIAIIDMKTKRTEGIHVNVNMFKNVIKVKNEPGIIRYSVCMLLKEIIEKRKDINTLLIVDGEEDVLVLPTSLYADFNSVILYGQPNAGTVVMEVNKYSKWRAYDLFSKLKVKKC